MKKFLLIIIFILAVTNILLAIQFLILKEEKKKLELFNEKQSKPIQQKSRTGTYLSLDNVNFRFAENVPVLLKNVNADLIPQNKSGVVNFDDPNSFIISIFKADAYIKAETLEVIFKEYIFNYPESVLKLDRIKFIDEKNNKIFLNGSLKFIIWLDFELEGTLSFSKEKKQILIAADKITALGIGGAKSLLGLVALNLEKLLPIPDGRGVTVKDNTIYVSPFAIFPPPKMEGEVQFINLENNFLHIFMDNGKSVPVPPRPIPKSKNYLFLFKGDMKFGKLFMVDTYLQMVDTDETDIFDFYLKEYFRILSDHGTATLGRDKSVKVTMPDYNDTIKK